MAVAPRRSQQGMLQPLGSEKHRERHVLGILHVDRGFIATIRESQIIEGD